MDPGKYQGKEQRTRFLDPDGKRLEGAFGEGPWLAQYCNKGQARRAKRENVPGVYNAQRCSHDHAKHTDQSICGNGGQANRAVESHLHGTRQPKYVSTDGRRKEICCEETCEGQEHAILEPDINPTRSQEDMPSPRYCKTGDEEQNRNP